MTSIALGCGTSGNGEGGSSDIAFHAEADALPGFSYDTGPQPASGPAQLSLALVTEGKVTVDAKATIGADRVEGRPQGGELALDVRLGLEGHLKVDTKGAKYDGPLPGLANVHVPVAGKTVFDGLALDGVEPTVTAEIPETKLPDVPLGSVPGHLSITIVKGSTLATTFHGRCAAVKGEAATYDGTTSTTGTFLLKAQLVLDLPLVKPIDLPMITVPVTIGAHAITAAPIVVEGAHDLATGACAEPPNGSPSGGSSSGSSSGNADGGVEAGEKRCALAEIAGASTVDATFVSLGTAAAPTMTGGAPLDGSYRVTGATVYLPTVANAMTAKGTVAGWVKLQSTGDYRMKIDARASVDTPLGTMQMLEEHVAGMGTFVASGASLSFAPKTCDPAATDDGVAYGFTNAAGKTQLLLRAAIQSFDTYVLLDLTE